MQAVLKGVHANLRFQVYPAQTKILEGRADVSECIFEALFKGARTQFGLRIVEKCFENHAPQTTPLKSASKIWIYLLFLLPKSSFGMDNLVSSTDASTCCHLVYSTDTSACYYHLAVIL